MLESPRIKTKRALINRYDSAASNNDDVGYLGDSNVVSNVNRKNPTEASASYLQNNQAEDHVESHDDVGCDFNNSCESASDLCGDLAIIGEKIIQQRIVWQRIMHQLLATKRTP